MAGQKPDSAARSGIRSNDLLTRIMHQVLRIFAIEALLI
jgi:hypothetical protein